MIYCSQSMCNKWFIAHNVCIQNESTKKCILCTHIFLLTYLSSSPSSSLISCLLLPLIFLHIVLGTSFESGTWIHDKLVYTLYTVIVTLVIIRNRTQTSVVESQSTNHMANESETFFDEIKLIFMFWYELMLILI